MIAYDPWNGTLNFRYTIYSHTMFAEALSKQQSIAPAMRVLRCAPSLWSHPSPMRAPSPSAPWFRLSAAGGYDWPPGWDSRGPESRSSCRPQTAWVGAPDPPWSTWAVPRQSDRRCPLLDFQSSLSRAEAQAGAVESLSPLAQLLRYRQRAENT